MILLMPLGLVIMPSTTGLSYKLTGAEMAVKLYTNYNWLRKRYYLDKKKPDEIAKECGVSTVTIYSYLDKFGLRKK
jgi:hypothetical protein